jgi:hypothetical protein
VDISTVIAMTSTPVVHEVSQNGLQKVQEENSNKEVYEEEPSRAFIMHDEPQWHH